MAGKKHPKSENALLAAIRNNPWEYGGIAAETLAPAGAGAYVIRKLMRGGAEAPSVPPRIGSSAAEKSAYEAIRAASAENAKRQTIQRALPRISDVEIVHPDDWKPRVPKGVTTDPELFRPNPYLEVKVPSARPAPSAPTPTPSTASRAAGTLGKVARGVGSALSAGAFTDLAQVAEPERKDIGFMGIDVDQEKLAAIYDAIKRKLGME